MELVAFNCMDGSSMTIRIDNISLVEIGETEGHIWRSSVQKYKVEKEEAEKVRIAWVNWYATISQPKVETS